MISLEQFRYTLPLNLTRGNIEGLKNYSFLTRKTGSMAFLLSLVIHLGTMYWYKLDENYLVIYLVSFTA